MSEQLRRLIPQARTLITKESFRDQSFGSLDGYIQDISRPIDIAPLVRIVQTAMKIFPPRDEASDGWLAPRVHASLRLFRSEAADQGIWDYLSVVVLRDYIIWRMAGEDGLINNLDNVIGPFRHQAVARLWWAAELSRNGADYRPTKEAFSSQDAVNYLTNVDAFHNRPAALAYIRFISHRSGATPIKQIAVETGKTLNHVLTTIVLDSFAPDAGSDMDALERWMAEAPDVTLVDSVLPTGPDEPPVPEVKIRAVEELLERLMEERRWVEVVDWSEKWIAEKSPAPVEPPLTAASLGGDKDAVKDDVVYETFVKALRKDLGVEPSDQTHELFEKLSQSPESHSPETLEGLSNGETSRKGHVELGDAPAAIVVTAESVYEKLSPEEQTIARRIFLQLTELGEGAQDTPRSSTIEELVLRPKDALPVEALLKRLADARLITMDENVVQVADNALIREWQRLREWLNADRAGMRLHRLIIQAAREWELSQRDPSALYRGARLAQALEWAKADELSMREQEFLDASKEFAEREGQSLAEAESGDAPAAIVVTAESAYEKLSPEEQTIARRILLQLTELGEGAQDTPRSSTIEELVLRPKDALPVEAMLKMLADALRRMS